MEVSLNQFDKIPKKGQVITGMLFRERYRVLSINKKNWTAELEKIE